MTPALSNDERRITAEASEWAVRLSDLSSTEEKAGFEAWLAADPRHPAAFDAADNLWRALGDDGEIAALAREPDPPARRVRPALLWAGALAAAAAAVFAFQLPNVVRVAPHYDTQIAEIRPITLEDGSVITLGARSEIDVHFTEGERRVTLRSGEAFFDVTPDAARPFIVAAGDARIRVVGTQFDVRRGVERVDVAVLEGEVRVSNRVRLGGAESVRVLRPGERIEVDDGNLLTASISPLPAVRDVAAMPAGAWRDGRLAYHDVRLAEVVADLNRYYAPGITLASRSIGDMRITAALRTDETSSFVRDLTTIAPVRVEGNAGGPLVIKAGPSAQ